MSTVAINKSVLFERIIPSQYVPAQESIMASQKRLSLQDALNNNDMKRAQKAIEEYRTHLHLLIKNLEQNRSMAILSGKVQWFK